MGDRIAIIGAGISGLAAGHHFGNEEYQKALEALERISASRKDRIYYQGMALKGQILTAQEKYDEALRLYSSIEQEAPSGFPQEEVLFRMAEIHAARQEADQALALYNRINEDFPQTMTAYKAQREAAKLEEKN